MSDTTTNLQLSYLAPGQAQKHVTVNESLRLLDALVQLAVVSATVTAEPGSPADGAVYILPAGKTGTHWGGFANGALAYYRDGAWVEITPRAGWLACAQDAGVVLRFTGSAWANLSVAEIAGALALTGAISPSQITSNQNDYSPTGLSGASVLRLSTDASRNLTGLAGGASGRLAVVENIGTHDLVLKNADAGSTAANRFAIGADLTLGADQGAVLIYDATSSRWRLFGGAGAGGGGGLSAATNAETQALTSTTKAVTPSNLANRARFSAHKNGTSQTGIASGAYVKLTFTTEAEDVGGYYDAANSKWVPPAGPVRLNASAFMTTDVTVNSLCTCAIYKNGSILKAGFTYATVPNAAGPQVTCLDTANGTDEYEAYVFVTASGTGTCNGAASFCYFQGEQV